MGGNPYEKHILAAGIFILGLYFISKEMQFIPQPAAPALVGAVVATVVAIELAYDRWYIGLILVGLLTALFLPLLFSPAIETEKKQALAIALACIALIAAAPAVLTLRQKMRPSGKS